MLYFRFIYIKKLSMINYYLTVHAIERLQERFPHLITQPDLLKWKKGLPYEGFYSVFRQILKQSSEVKSILNNMAIMMPYYEKYGYDSQYAFYEYAEQKLLMVFAKDSHEQKNFALVTVLPSHFRLAQKKHEYKKVKKVKEEREAMAFMQRYEEAREQSLLVAQGNLAEDIDIKYKLIQSVHNKTATRDIGNRYLHSINDLEYHFEYIERENDKHDFSIISVQTSTIGGEVFTPESGLAEQIKQQYQAGNVSEAGQFSRRYKRWSINLNNQTYYFIVNREGNVLLHQT